MLTNIVRIFKTSAIVAVFHYACVLHLLAQQSTIGKIAQEKLYFSHLGIEQGLSQGSALCLVQDTKGFLWIGTEDGLNRYDGYTFTTFRHRPNDSTSLPNNLIYTLYEDRSGVLWAGTRAGLCQYNAASESFIHTTNVPNPKGVFALYEDKRGILWVGTLGDGLQKIDRTTGNITTFTHNPQNPQSISNNKVYSICEDAHGNLWVGTEEGLCRFNADNGSFTRYTHHPTKPSSLSHNIVRVVYTDRHGALWVGTFGGGLCQYNNVTNDFTTYTTEAKNSLSLSGNEVNALYEDHRGEFWIGTRNGLCRFDREKKIFTTFQHDPKDDQSLKINNIASIVEDRSGLLWFGTGGNGLSYVHPEANHFMVYRQTLYDTLSLPHNAVRAVCEEHFGNKALWVGTANGLWRYDRTTGAERIFRRQTHRGIHIAKGLPDNDIRSLYCDRRGMLWIGTFSGGLCRYDFKKNTFKQYRQNTNDSASIQTKVIFKIFEDRGGELWVGTNSSLLYNYNRAADSFVSRGVGAGAVRAMVEGSDGGLWLGTSDGGLWRFDRTTDSCVQFVYDKSTSAATGSNNVRCMYEDTTSKGILWLGTNGGLFLVNIKTGTVRHWTEAEGLPNNVVYGILPDDAGNLWLSTNRGLAKFNPTSQTFRAYTLSDGLPSNEFNQGAYFRANSGELFFGSMEGLVSFLPNRVLDNPFLPPVVLTAFKKFNKVVLLDTAISAAHVIEIYHSDNFISFEFAALNYVNPQKNQYAYKLEGFDRDWIQAGTQRSVNYTNLDPGTYQFRVRASNNDGVWNKTGSTLELRILPPWWLTWWFRGLVVILFVGGLGAGYYVRINVVEMQNRKLKQVVHVRTQELQTTLAELEANNREIHQQHGILEEQAREIEMVNTTLHEKNHLLEHLNHEKNEFLGIVAHDLKNPITSIKLIASMMQRYRDKITGDDVMKQMQKVEFTATRMEEIVTNLLDINAIESGALSLKSIECDIADTLKAIVEQYRMQADAKGITLIYDNVSSARVIVDPIRAWEVLDNLLSNAIKYSPLGKTIWMTITMKNRNKGTQSEAASQHSVQISIRDEGPGVSEEDMAKLFGKFARLSARPTAGEQSTGLGLSIVKKLVEAMNGKVWCESELGKGATFIVELPVVEG
ncbi:MAG: hypothetical protein H9535_19500 [Ignavibacteria bacterium]|nr:hypothetical protein [Ignavibacteria bacterium]